MEYWVNIFKLGTTPLHGPDELRNVQFIIEQMQRFGHAVTFHEKYDEAGKWESGAVTHFLTCRACMEIKLEIEKDGRISQSIPRGSDGQIRQVEGQAAGVRTGAELPTESGRIQEQMPAARNFGISEDVQLGAADEKELRGSNQQGEHRVRSPLTAFGRELRSFRPNKDNVGERPIVLPADGALQLGNRSSFVVVGSQEGETAKLTYSLMANNERAKQGAPSSGPAAAAGDGGVFEDLDQIARWCGAIGSTGRVRVPIKLKTKRGKHESNTKKGKHGNSGSARVPKIKTRRGAVRKRKRHE